ncbi:M20/M25/M40 family metallo-hydrolase, partial [Odoribacter sp. OttesenSCG-928-L07]|nr:M20/M25/M40 family metallo-hydrolase [Odoribacter sp. OttesenSCG-928-L07]
QNLSYPTSDFTKTPKVVIDGKELIPAGNFIVTRASKSVKGNYTIVPFFNDSVKNDDALQSILKQGDKTKVLLTDRYHSDLRNKNFEPYAGTIIVSKNNRLPWAMSDAGELKDNFTVYVTENAINPSAKKLEIEIKNKHIKKFKTRNVVGFIPGKSEDAKYLMIGAHYDHLGGFGKDIYMPGANDNSTGVATLLAIAKYLKDENIELEHNLLIVAFTGEEAGLLGSKFFADNPPIPLEKIDFFINFDMVGGGSAGITVVQGAAFPEETNKLKELNERNNYFPEIVVKGITYNSDHAPLYAKNVPSVFIHTQGSGLVEYHNIYDLPYKYILDRSCEFVQLMVEFLQELDKK